MLPLGNVEDLIFLLYARYPALILQGLQVLDDFVDVYSEPLGDPACRGRATADQGNDAVTGYI
jgi:hypothetical protein